MAYWVSSTAGALTLRALSSAACTGSALSQRTTKVGGEFEFVPLPASVPLGGGVRISPRRPVPPIPGIPTPMPPACSLPPVPLPELLSGDLLNLGVTVSAHGESVRT